MSQTNDKDIFFSAIKYTCEKCHGRAYGNCAYCPLFKAGEMWRLIKENGVTMKEAYDKVEKNLEYQINYRRWQYDARAGFVSPTAKIRKVEQ